MSPSLALERAVGEIVEIVAARPNDAITFSKVLERLERWPGVSRESAIQIASRAIPGSRKAWQAREDERARRLARAAVTGRIN